MLGEVGGLSASIHVGCTPDAESSESSTGIVTATTSNSSNLSARWPAVRTLRWQRQGLSVKLYSEKRSFEDRRITLVVWPCWQLCMKLACLCGGGLHKPSVVLTDTQWDMWAACTMRALYNMRSAENHLASHLCRRQGDPVICICVSVTKE